MIPLTSAAIHANLLLGVRKSRIRSRLDWTRGGFGLLAVVGEMEGIKENMTGNTENTDSYADSQLKSYPGCARDEFARESATMGKEENEGVRLDQVLAGHGLNRAKLAKIAKVGPSTVQGWYEGLRRGDITESTWHKLARALIAAEIDPNEVRPGAEIPTKTRAATLIPALWDVLESRDRTVINLMLELVTVDDSNERETIAAVLRSALRKL